MTEKDMIEAIRHETGCTAAAARSAVKLLFRAIADELTLTQESMRLPELGSLRRVAREARQSRNVRTGERITIPARYAVQFSPGKPLKRRLKELAPPSFGQRQAAE